MKRHGILLAFFLGVTFCFVSCSDPISKEEAKKQIDEYFSGHPPTFTFYIPIKDNFLWSNSESNNGDSNFIKSTTNTYSKYYMHLINNLRIFGALNYKFTKESDGIRINTEFTDKFKGLIKVRSHWDNDSNGEHITIISGSLQAKIVSTELGQFKDGRQASIVNFNTEFTPNDIRNIFSGEKDEGKDIHKANFSNTGGRWKLEL